MKQRFSERKPLLASILWALLILVFYIFGGAVTTITKTGEVSSLYLNGVFVLASILTALLYIKLSGANFSVFGLKGIEGKSSGQVLYYIPAIIIEVLGLTVGFRQLNISYIIAAFFFTLLVGIAEELYFRGIIIKVLKKNGTLYTIIVSSVIFGVTHIGNLAGSANIILTLIQIVFAFTFGLVFAEIFILTKSLLPVILWHFLHDFLGYIETETNILSLNQTILLAGAQCILFIVYSIYLWKKVKQQQN